jgi:hypothetical protein
MSKELKSQIRHRDDEISLRDLFVKIRNAYRILLKNWWKLAISGFVGAGLGIVYTWVHKTRYTAELVFVTAEAEEEGFSKLSAIGSQFGFDFGGGSSGAFGGDNILELMKSRLLVEQTLFDSFAYEGKRYRLLEYYLIRDSLEKSETPAVPLTGIANRESCEFRQDSLLKEVYRRITKGGLVVESQDKELAFKKVAFTDVDPVFAKAFVENLTENVTDFYLETKFRQARSNIRLLERKADSVERVLRSRMVSVAVQRDQNQFLTNSEGTVQMVKQQMEVQLLTTMYGEVVKNLELSRTMSAHNQPIIQVIDRPRFPLEDDGGGLLKYMVFGGLLGVVVVGLFIITGAGIKRLKLEDLGN